MDPVSPLAYVSVGGGDQIVAVRLPLGSAAPSVAWRTPVSGKPGAQVLGSDGKRLYVALRGDHAIAWFDLTPGGRLDLGGTMDAGMNPVHLALSLDGRRLTWCSYGEDQVGSCILADGEPAGPARRWPTGRHPHAVVWAPSGGLLYVPCLGEDRIRSYRFDDDREDLTAADADVDLPPGTGPRHLRFDPSGSWACCVGELGNRLDLLGSDAQGRLTLLGGEATVPLLARLRSNKPAEVRWGDPSTVYVSNRGHDSIAVFRVVHGSDEGPSLRRVGCIPTEPGPRSFDVDPGGPLLVVAGQASGRIAFHPMNANGGAGAPSTVEVGPGPSWITIAEAPLEAPVSGPA